MRRGFLFSIFMGLLVFSISIPSYSWQGRMAGMGDPYGLISDDSDFLIHPAKITFSDEKFIRNEWSVSTGFSILFGR